MSQLIASDYKRLIVGMGATGLSCARFLSSAGISFDMWDTRTELKNQQDIRAEFADSELILGELDGERLSAYDELIVSPGIAIAEPAIQQATQNGTRIRGDVDVFAEYVNRNNQDETHYKPVIAVTGSNGKSTVVTLVGEILAAQGKKPAVCGNIGLPVLDVLREEEKYDCYVVELSSFQLETTHHLAADAACVLNLSEDHMDRYANMMAYHQAKHRIFQGCRSVVVNRDDTLTQPLVSDAMPTISFGQHAPDNAQGRKKQFALRLQDGQEYIGYEEQLLLTTSEMKIKGRHNALNAMAAMALVTSIKSPGFAIQPVDMLSAIKEFAGLPHRCAWVGEVNGISYYNDSKGTNVGSTLAAIDGLGSAKKNIVLIAGGVGKDQDFEPLNDSCAQFVKQLVLFGRDRELIAAACQSQVGKIDQVDSLRKALNCANEKASVGDIVLFSPACASFDQFENYVQRGFVFEQLVAELQEGV